jgi:hypothetical protein
VSHAVNGSDTDDDEDWHMVTSIAALVIFPGGLIVGHC